MYAESIAEVTGMRPIRGFLAAIQSKEPTPADASKIFGGTLRWIFWMVDSSQYITTSNSFCSFPFVIHSLDSHNRLRKDRNGKKKKISSIWISMGIKADMKKSFMIRPPHSIPFMKVPFRSWRYHPARHHHRLNHVYVCRAECWAAEDTLLLIEALEALKTESRPVCGVMTLVSDESESDGVPVWSNNLGNTQESLASSPNSWSTAISIGSLVAHTTGERSCGFSFILLTRPGCKHLALLVRMLWDLMCAFKIRRSTRQLPPFLSSRLSSPWPSPPWWYSRHYSWDSSCSLLGWVAFN